MASFTRRAILSSGFAWGAAVPLALQLDAPFAAAAQSPPPYTFSVNIDYLFPARISKADRVQRVADLGFKAYSYVIASDAEQEAMLKIQQATGIRCANVPGTNGSGGPGLTTTGAEATYLDEITVHAKIAAKMGGALPVISVGRQQSDIPWETQRVQIVTGLRKAGDIAKEFGVVLVMEPLSDRGSVKMALNTAAVAFPVIDEVAHPNVKVCFDVYHLQLTEGNISAHLREGLQKNLIGLVQIREVPGGNEPGTGEIDYNYIFRVLREANYQGYLETEMGTSTTPEAALALVWKMSIEN